MNFNDVIGVTTNAQAIVSFVTGDSVKAAMTDLIGGVHVKAALTSMDQVDKSKYPLDRIRYLQSLILRLHKLYSKLNLKIAASFPKH